MFLMIVTKYNHENVSDHGIPELKNHQSLLLAGCPEEWGSHATISGGEQRAIYYFCNHFLTTFKFASRDFDLSVTIINSKTDTDSEIV